MAFHRDLYWALFYLIYIYINDLHKCTNKFDIINYADDTTLISTINQFDNHGTGMNDNINNELRNVHNWLLAQRLSLNVSKTRLMNFLHATKNVPSLKLSICNLNIEEVDHFNFLGLIIDKNMKWHTHVQKVANKIRNVNGILHKFKYVFPHRILILIYTSLIESHINYCILLWGINYDKIFKLQKQAIRTISLNNFKAHTSPLFKSMNLLDITDTYQLQLLKLYYKVKNSLVPSYFTNFYKFHYI